ncbi:MAG: helix-turn-helix transcriptional regulator [Eubacterium sp.]
MSFSENLRRARKQAGMNQTQLAEAIGSKQNDVSRWEKAEFTPKLKKWLRSVRCCMSPQMSCWRLELSSRRK